MDYSQPLQLSVLGGSEDIVLILPEGSISDSDVEIVGVWGSLGHTFLPTNGEEESQSGSSHRDHGLGCDTVWAPAYS